jgi:hypothetical protein
VSTPDPDLSILVQLHDELDALPELYLQITAACDALGRSYEVVFVDDGSRDGSGPLLDALVDEDPRVRVIHLRRNFGKDAALAVGFSRVRGTLVVTLDADLQDDPAMIADFVARLDGDADVVTGWPQRPSYPMVGRLEGALIHRFVGLEQHDLDCGLRGYRNSALQQLADQHAAARLLPVLAHTRGLRVQEVVVNHREPKHPRIKARDHRRTRLAEVLAVVTQAARARPLRVLAVPGTITVAAGLITLLLFGLIVPLHFLTGTWLGLGLLLAIFGGQLIVAGLLADLVLGAERRAPAHAIASERESDEEEFETRTMQAAPRTPTGTVVAPAPTSARPVTYSSPAARPITAPAPVVGGDEDDESEQPTATHQQPIAHSSGPMTEQFVAGSLRLPTRPTTAPAAVVPNPLDMEIDEDEGPATIAIERNPFHRPSG